MLSVLGFWFRLRGGRCPSEPHTPLHNTVLPVSNFASGSALALRPGAHAAPPNPLARNVDTARLLGAHAQFDFQPLVLSLPLFNGVAIAKDSFGLT
jgi:hypothetical protein